MYPPNNRNMASRPKLVWLACYIQFRSDKSVLESRCFFLFYIFLFYSPRSKHIMSNKSNAEFKINNTKIFLELFLNFFFSSVYKIKKNILIPFHPQYVLIYFIFFFNTSRHYTFLHSQHWKTLHYYIFWYESSPRPLFNYFSHLLDGWFICWNQFRNGSRIKTRKPYFVY